MKTKELKQLRTKTVTEIDAILAKKQAELLKTKIAVLESKEKNLRKPKALRHEIAQILTIRGIIERS